VEAAFNSAAMSRIVIHGAAGTNFNPTHAILIARKSVTVPIAADPAASVMKLTSFFNNSDAIESGQRHKGRLARAPNRSFRPKKGLIHVLWKMPRG